MSTERIKTRGIIFNPADVVRSMLTNVDSITQSTFIDWDNISESSIKLDLSADAPKIIPREIES